MAWGGLLVPGSNDSLILLGMPLLWSYAWVAFATMCAAIAIGRLLRPRQPEAPPSRSGAQRA
jgi:toxin CptA